MRAVLTCSVLLVCSMAARAVLDDYSPFEPNEKPKPFAFTALTNVSCVQDSGLMRYEFASPDQTNVLLSVLRTTNSEVRLSVARTKGSAPFSTAIELEFYGGLDAYAADLNGDGIPDYIIRAGSGGCGLAGEITYMTFVLSSRTGYVAHCLESYDAEPTDVLDLNRSGKPVFLHTMFVYGEAGRDGKEHNYWVYNLLGFSGTDMVSANAVDKRFPKWVWYKFKPNHAATDQLTSEQKKRLWAKTWKWEEDHYGRAMFYHWAAFTEEQGKPAINAEEVRGSNAGREEMR